MSKDNIYYGIFGKHNTDEQNAKEPSENHNSRAGGNGGGGNRLDEVEKRITALENKTDNLIKNTSEIGKRIDVLAENIAEIKGRLAVMPTTGQLVSLIFAVMGGVCAIMGIAFIIIRFGMAH